MADQEREQLMNELAELRRRVADLEKSGADGNRVWEEHLEAGSPYNAALQSMADAVHVVDRDLRITLFNSKFKLWSEELGLQTEATGNRLFDVFPFLSEKVRNEYEQVLKSGQMLTTEEATPVGDKVYFSETRKIPIIREGRVTSVVTVIRDVTEQKKAEQALRASEEKYRELVEDANSIIVRSDKEGKIIFVNEFAQQFFGYGESELVGRNVIGTIVPEVESTGRDLKKMVEDIRLNPDQYTNNLNENIRRNGERVWIAWTNRPKGDEHGRVKEILSIGNDVTARKQAEETIREKETTLRSLIDATRETLLLVDSKGTILIANETVAQRLGKTVAELAGTSMYDHLPPDTAAIRKEASEKVVRTGRPVHFQDERAGRVYDNHEYPVFGEDGRVRKVAIFANDITERKEAEEILQEYEKAIEGSQDMIATIDRDYRYRLANSTFLRYGDVGKEQVIGRSVAEVLGSDVFERIVKGHMDKCFRGEVVQYEMKCSYPTLGERELLISYLPVGGPDGIDRVAAVIRDVTDQRLAEKALREDEEKFRLLFERSVDPILLLDGDTYVDCNEAAVRLMGCADKAQLIGLHPFDMTPERQPDGRLSSEKVRELNETALREGTNRFEWVRRTFQGEELWLDVSLTAIPVRGKRMLYTIWKDITKRKLEEGALRQAEKKYRAIFDNAMEGIFQSTPNGTYISVNPALARMFGYAGPEELINTVTNIGRQQYVDPCRRREFQETLSKNRVLNDFEVEAVRKDGSRLWVNVNARAIPGEHGEVSYFEGTMEDITSRKQFEEQLKESEERYRTAIEHSSDAVAMFDGDVPVFVNRRYMEIFGYTDLKEILDAPPYQRVHPPDRNRMMDRNRRRQQGEDVPGRYEFRGLRKDGTVIHLEVSATRVVYRDRPMTLAYMRDVTERIRAAQAIEEERKRLSDIVEFLPDATVVIDNGNRVIAWNRAMEMMTGVRKEDILGKGDFAYAEVFYHEKRPMLIDAVQGNFPEIEDKYQSLRWDGNVVYAEAFARAAGDRKAMHLWAVAAPLFNADGDRIGAIESVRDITERKSLEAQLLQAQKMEAIGTLAGGVAHDFNNILMALMGYAGLIDMHISKDHPVRPYVEQILACTGKAANVTQSLLAFSRKQVMEFKPHSLNSIVRDLEKLLRRLLPEDIDLEVSLGDDITVMADMAQMDQVLINLVANARDAMSKGGFLHIETGMVQPDQEFVLTHGVSSPGAHALISVADSGCGMDEETKERIFEPFFTTKEVGKGTGLGLSIVYGIVTQHNGYIDVKSEPGKGTTFRIYLPATETITRDGAQNDPNVTGGTETLIFAEDNPDLRRIAGEVLGASGYTVIEAVDGEDALEKFMANEKTIDLLVFDVVMPRKNGKEAYEAIRKVRPGIRTLFMSGYTADVVIDKGIEEGMVDYISKPLLPTQLLRKVREILDR
jgi:two-component system, cell cycle sensor histidine kinase and response regulator CckA